MNYDSFKTQLMVLRTMILDDPKLSEQEREDLKASILLLIMHVNHRKAEGK